MKTDDFALYAKHSNEAHVQSIILTIPHLPASHTRTHPHICTHTHTQCTNKHGHGTHTHIHTICTNEAVLLSSLFRSWLTETCINHNKQRDEFLIRSSLPVSSAPASYGEEMLWCARYMEPDMAGPPSGGLLTETCLSGLPRAGHDLLDRAVSLELRLALRKRSLYLQEALDS